MVESVAYKYPLFVTTTHVAVNSKLIAKCIHKLPLEGFMHVHQHHKHISFDEPGANLGIVKNLSESKRMDLENNNRYVVHHCNSCYNV